MSEPRDIPQNAPAKSLAELIETGTDSEIRARVVEVLDRGIINDQLNVPLPPEWHGEWVLNDSREIHRMKLLGFKIDEEFAMKSALHNDGSGAPVVGDTIFMIRPMRVHSIFEQERTNRFKDRNVGNKGKNLAEESLGTDLPTVNESSTSRVNSNQLIATMHAES